MWHFNQGNKWEVLWQKHSIQATTESTEDDVQEMDLIDLFTRLVGTKQAEDNVKQINMV
jgi:hypothetical protein